MSLGADLPSAMRAWAQRIGEAAVIPGAAAQQRYGASTGGVERAIAAALRPRWVEDVPAIVEIAAAYTIPLYPISTGKNWGYGTALPVRDGGVILDLSGLDQIIEMDESFGLVTIEPGVTQKKLSDYLEANRLPFMVPVTGAGPDCSLVGNALERGYGITPYSDHFGAVMALEAVLPDGRLYRSALTELNGEVVDRAYKWGIGPYLDGLFAQSGFGIVTRMTLALAPRPACIQAFVFGAEEEPGFEPLLAAVQQALRAAGAAVGSINLMNARRVLAMTVPYPRDRVNDNGLLPATVVAELARASRVAAWTGFGALYGEAAVVKAARGVIRRVLKPAAQRLRFVSPVTVARIDRWLNRVPGLRGGALSRQARTMMAAMELVAGKPSRVALPLAYWQNALPPQRDGALDPAADGCGLIWYSPLVPMTPARVRRYVTTVGEVCARHRIEPLITLTSLSDRCFDSTVPLLFDRSDRDAAARARACYFALLEAGKSEGFLPYRLGIEAMDWLARPGLPYWDLMTAIKSAIDPHRIIAPGRYGP